MERRELCEPWFTGVAFRYKLCSPRSLVSDFLFGSKKSMFVRHVKFRKRAKNNCTALHHKYLSRPTHEARSGDRFLGGVPPGQSCQDPQQPLGQGRLSEAVPLQRFCQQGDRVGTSLPPADE